MHLKSRSTLIALLTGIFGVTSALFAAPLHASLPNQSCPTGIDGSDCVANDLQPTGAEVVGDATIVNRGMVGSDVRIEYYRLGAAGDTQLGARTIFLGPGRSFDFSAFFPVIEGKQTFEVRLIALGYDDEWILQRTGIKERRHAPPEMATPSAAERPPESAAWAVRSFARVAMDIPI